jgi:hypothetical protein
MVEQMMQPLLVFCVRGGERSRIQVWSEPRPESLTIGRRKAGLTVVSAQARFQIQIMWWLRVHRFFS